jgi:cellulose synthase/poly-beta-1,6-N-acetylglucosamine synthase-like glycosyltransferase
MLTGVLAACLLLLAFTYAGYPVLIAARARFAARPPAESEWEPCVTVLLVVHEAVAGEIHDQLVAKLDNLFAFDYPPDKLTVRVGCDGDLDTGGLPRHRNHGRLVLHHLGRRRGKSACLDALLGYVEDEVVMFCDLRQRIEAGALRALLRKLANPDVGAVSGELRFERGDGGGADAYWRYEKWIRSNEAASSSVVGVTGAIYAARRALLPRIAEGLILDDLWIPLQIAGRGARIAFAQDAIAWDRVAGGTQEDNRKRRTLAGNYQLLAREPSLRWPWRHPLGWRLLAHKWLRLAAPWLLLIAFVSNAWLAGSGSVYALLFVGQCALYLTACFGLRIARLPGLLHLPTTFVRLNLCAVLGLFDYLRNPQRGHLWSNPRAAGESRS